MRPAVVLGAGAGLIVGGVAWAVLHGRGHADRVGGAIVGATLMTTICIAAVVGSRHRRS